MWQTAPAADRAALAGGGRYNAVTMPIPAPPPVSEPAAPTRGAAPAGARPGKPAVPVPVERIAAFCRKWGITEFSLFGSVLRDDFRPDSDVDVLVTFHPGGGYTFETLPDLLDELSALFGGRAIDLVEKPLLTNPFRRHAILTSRQVIYAA